MNLARMERAIVDRLKEQLGGIAGSVTSYSGELEQAVQGIEVATPAVLVALEEMTREEDASSFSADAARVTWTVTVLAHSMRGRDDVRAGASGAYALADAVQDAMSRYEFGVDGFTPLSFQGMRLVISRPTVVAYTLTYFGFAEV